MILWEVKIVVWLELGRILRIRGVVGRERIGRDLNGGQRRVVELVNNGALRPIHMIHGDANFHNVLNDSVLSKI